MESPDPPCRVPPSLAVKPRLVRQLLLPIPLLLLMLAFGYGGYRISENAGIRTLAENGERQLELHARTVESEISKYTYLPSLLEAGAQRQPVADRPDAVPAEHGQHLP